MQQSRCSSEAAIIQPGQAVWLLSTFSALHQRSFDTARLARACVPPITHEGFAHIAQQLGLDARFSYGKKLETGSLPLAAKTLPVQTPAEDAPRADSDSQNRAREHDSAGDWTIVLQLEADAAVILQCGSDSPLRISKVDLESRLADISVVFTPSVEPASDPDAAAAARTRFGFRWFIPELLKHKAIWREVLLASLVLQLIALAFPLFTQAIIDKVVVHRTESTLIALTVGMSVFIVFTTLLTWIRQYLVLHTGNRVDAVLGSHVFEHLFTSKAGMER